MDPRYILAGDDSDPTWIASTTGDWSEADEPMGSANARLIAAAPELLMALRDANDVECVNMCVVLKGSTVKSPLMRHSERCQRQRRAIEQATSKGAQQVSR